MNYRVRTLDAKHAVKDFQCSEPVLNEYLQRYAGQDVARGVSRVFVASPTDDLSEVAGFFTLSAASVQSEHLPEAVRKRLPRYPVPVALLGRLAVSKKHSGKGLGSMLLVDACKRVNAASNTLAVAAIVVDAKSQQAASFYRHFGFEEMPGQPHRWFISRRIFTQLG